MDFAGECIIALEETGGPREYKILNKSGVPVQKKGKDCHLYVSITKRSSSGPESAVPGAWLVTVHKADQIPNMDKHGPEWGFNFTGAKSDGFVLVTAFNGPTSAPSNLGPRPTESSQCIMNTNHPVWEETFEFGLCDAGNMTNLMQECGLGDATSGMEQLTSWFPPERHHDGVSDAQADAQDKAACESFLHHIGTQGFGSAFL